MQITVNPAAARSPRTAPQVLLWLMCICIGFSSNASRADEVDPAGRVARISYLQGPVYVQTADDDSWSEAKINRPLTSGDQLWTDARGRSELQMGSTTVQIDANTQLRIAELNDDELQLVVTQGLVNVRVRQLGKDDAVEISTPNAAVRPAEPGSYRIEVADNDDLTVVQIRDGEAQIAGAKQDFTLGVGEQLSLRGTKRLTAEFDELARMDEFDRWAADRNERAERVAASRYVSPDVIGYEDLDDYGSWRQYDDYGYVWIPTRVHSGWAPYRYGHWTWVSPWGWTWIDDAPWGFAPFHYGRWAMLDRRWCWVPGPRTVRAVYAPALVAWVGTPGVSVSINIGRQPVGWIPLGPREVYRPYYHGSRDYITRVNLSNTRLNSSEFERGYRRQPHDDDYRNRGAASVVQADALRTAQPVNNHLIRPGRTQLQPLTTQPVARPERGEADNRSQRFTPPMAANPREVLTRRDFGKRDDANRGGPRNQGNLDHSGMNTPDGARSNERNSDQNRWRSNRDNDAGNSGRIIDGRNNNDNRANRAPDADRAAPRDQTRDRSNDPRLPGNRDSRAVSPAPSPPVEASPQPYSRPGTAPTPERTPEAAPRIRNEGWVRDVAPAGRPQAIPPANAQPAPMERQRNVRVPNDPAPMRSAPDPQPAPTQSPRMPSSPDGGRPSRDSDDNGPRHGRDFR